MQNKVLSKSNFILFGIGVLFHYLGHLLSVIGEKGILNKTLSIIGLTIIVFTFIQNLKFIPFKKKYVLAIFLIYLIWSLFIIVRVDTQYLSTNTNDLLRAFFFDERFFLSYFIPLIVFFGKNFFKFKSIFYICILYSIANIILFCLNVQYVLNPELSVYSSWISEYIGLLFLPVVIILFSCRFVTNKHLLLPFISLLISLFSSVFLGRRAVTFMGLLSFILFIYMFYRKSKNKVFSIFIIILLITGSLLYYNKYILSKSDGRLVERLNTDNRGPEDRDSMNSLTTLEFFIGKGLTGSYYSKEHSIYRGMVESGIQHMIMKGGFIYLVLHLTILFYSFFVGFFKSNNDLIKGAALFILLKIILLYPLGSPQFDFQEVILWVCVLYCNSTAFRKMNNISIIRKLSVKKVILKQ